MPNRYARDELIKIALQMVQLPNLEVHDMPNGVVQPNAFAIQWLQDILDFWYHMVPFSATVKSTALNCVANQNYVTLPSDFILDVRNGFVVERIPGNAASKRRVIRVPLQKFINRRLLYQTSTNVDYPNFYCIQGDDDNVSTQFQRMQITPTPSISTNGELWYYALPATLESNQKPKFPNDYVCAEYIRIRALEWARVYEPGTAHKFCEKVIAGMKSAGLMNEPEDDEIPFDDLTFRRGYEGGTAYAWMGQR